MQCFKQGNCTCIIMTGTDMTPVPILSVDTNDNFQFILERFPISRQITKVRRKHVPPYACQLAIVGLHKFILHPRPSFWVILSSASTPAETGRHHSDCWVQMKCPSPSRTLLQRMTNTTFFQARLLLEKA